MIMRDNGSKHMSVKTMNIRGNDFRLGSKLKRNKEFLFNADSDIFHDIEETTYENYHDNYMWDTDEEEPENFPFSSLHSNSKMKNDSKSKTPPYEFSMQENVIKSSPSNSPNKNEEREDSKEEQKESPLRNEINLIDKAVQIEITERAELLNDEDKEKVNNNEEKKEVKKKSKLLIFKKILKSIKQIPRKVFSCMRRNNSRKYRKNAKNETDEESGTLNKSDNENVNLNEGTFISDNNNALLSSKIVLDYKNIQQVSIPYSPMEELKQEECDFSLEMESNPQGEKLIQIKLENKIILALPDLLIELVNFFRSPFDGSDIQPNLIIPDFNDFPPMIIEIQLNNIIALILGDLNDTSKYSLALLLDIYYNHSFMGDAWNGPGSVNQDINLFLKSMYVVDTDYIYGIFRPPTDQFINFSKLYANTIYPINVKVSMESMIPEYLIGNEDCKCKSTINAKIRVLRNKEVSIFFAMNHMKVITNVISTISNPTSEEISIKIADKVIPEFKLYGVWKYEYKIKVKKLNIEILRSANGAKVLNVNLNNVNAIVDGQDSTKNTDFSIELRVDYYNRRLLEYEPFLEPFKLQVKLFQNEETTEVKIFNSPSVSKNNFIQEHENSLNFNVTVPCIETLLEAYKLYQGQMNEEQPYIIKNKIGQPIIFTIEKKDNELRKIDSIKGENEMVLSYNDFTQEVRRSKITRDKNNKASINVVVLKRKTDLEREFGLVTDETFTPGNETKAETTLRRDVTIMDGSSYYPRTMTAKKTNLMTLARSFSNYKFIKQMDIETIGTYFIRLDRFNKPEPGDKRASEGFFKNISSKLNFKSKTLNENDEMFILLNSMINPKTGSKVIEISTNVRVKNQLGIPVEIGLKFPGKNDDFKVTIQHQKDFFIPINYLETRSLIWFRPDTEEAEEAIYDEIKTYNLDSLISEKSSISDFEREKNHPIFHGDNVIFVKKEDFEIQSMPYQGGSTEGDFNFVISCIKVERVAKGFKSNENNIFYETVLLMLPVIKVCNLLVRSIKVGIHELSSHKVSRASKSYLENPVLISPTKSYHSKLIKHSPDLAIEISNSSLGGSQFLKLFNKKEKTYVREIQLKESRNRSSTISIKIVRLSEFARILYVYCPYLILNETSLIMNYNQVIKGKKEDELRNSVNFEGKNYNEKFAFLSMLTHMESSNKLKISLKTTSENHNWSSPFSLLQNEGYVSLIESEKVSSNSQSMTFGSRLRSSVTSSFGKKKPERISSNQRRKYQFGIRVNQASDPFFLSKLIIITPKYMFHNETQFLLAFAQFDTTTMEDNIIRMKPNEWKEFYWTDCKKKELMMMSICDNITNNIQGWSGRFKLDKAAEIVLKVKNVEESEIEILYLRLIISITRNVYLVRIMDELPLNPPYFIKNTTRYEIAYRHKYKDEKNKHVERNIIYPDQQHRFTWDHWDLEQNFILEVEVEGTVTEYTPNNIKDIKPIILETSEKESGSKINTMYKKGNLIISTLNSNKFKDQKVFCSLSVQEQTLKIHTKDQGKIILSVRNARIEDIKDNEFYMISRDDIYRFETSNDDETLKWVDSIWNAILLKNSNIIHVKIVPLNNTKIIKFFMVKNEDNEVENRDEENQESSLKDNKILKVNFNIYNMIGITLIDSKPKEILQLSIRGIGFELIEKTSVSFDNSTILIIKPDDFEETKSVCILRTARITVDSIIINNQMDGSQFPVIFAPKKDKLNFKNPMINFYIKMTNVISYADRNLNNSTMSNYYVQYCSIELEKMEIKFEEAIIEALLSFYMQLSSFLTGSESPTNLMNEEFDSTHLLQSLNKYIKSNHQNQSMIFIKALNITPVQLFLTTRSSAGSSSTNELLTGIGVGLTLVSLESAKIRLSNINLTNYFGSFWEIIGDVMSKYKKQFIRKISRLLGSVDFLGDPLSFLENLFEATVSLFYDPIRNIQKRNLYQIIPSFGTKILNVGKAILSSLQILVRILEFLGRLSAMITFDKEFLHDRILFRSRVFNNINESLILGFSNIIKVLINTITGVFRQPISMYKENKTWYSFILGFFFAFLGFAIKPTIAIFDFFKSIQEGVKNSYIYHDEINLTDFRSRPPRIFGEENLLIPFSIIPAVGKDIVNRFKIRKMDKETICYCEEFTIQKNNICKRTITKAYQIVLTDSRILYAEKKSQLNFIKIRLHKISFIKFNKKKNEIIFKLNSANLNKKNKSRALKVGEIETFLSLRFHIEEMVRFKKIDYIEIK